MERGAERFFAALPDPDRRLGSQQEHLRAVVQAVAATLERRPDFLRILVVMAVQPPTRGNGEVHRVVDRVRELALQRLREQMHDRLRPRPAGDDADQLARFALASIDGAFVATQSHSEVRLGATARAPARSADRRATRARAGLGDRGEVGESERGEMPS